MDAVNAEFAAALLDPERPVPADILIRGGGDPARRFGVYRNNVIVSLMEAVEDSYPVVCALVGEDFFKAMARKFARQCPPQSPIMAHYGERFPKFIAEFPPASAIPYLADVAQLEWQRVVSWHAKDADSLAAEDVAHLLAEPASLLQSCWQLHPSLGLIDSPFAIVSLWSAHQLGSVLEIDQALSHLDWAQPESALVIRPHLEVLIFSLDRAESAFVAAIHAEKSLGDAVEEARTVSSEFDLTRLFALLLRSGALINHK